MITHNLGYPRIGNHRELKKACEQYWAGRITAAALHETAAQIRRQNWQLQHQLGIDMIPVNDFALYDHVLDTALLFGAIPDRYQPLLQNKQLSETDLLFAMARGYQKDGFDITAMEMTKWFDTNYHYIVPEFVPDQQFAILSNKIFAEYEEARALGIEAKPVILGPVSFLLLGKEKAKGFHRLELLPKLLPMYTQVLRRLQDAGATYIQIDEPCLSLDLPEQERDVYIKTYNDLLKPFTGLHIILASYFECYGKNLHAALRLPVQTLHLDLVRCPSQLDDILDSGFIHGKTNLSLGVVDGRNIWKNDFTQSLQLIDKAVRALGEKRLMIAPSCSLLHVPCDLANETNEQNLPADIKAWMAFAKQKLEEVLTLSKLAAQYISPDTHALLEQNQHSIEARRNSTHIHKKHIKQKVQALDAAASKRINNFEIRKQAQQQLLKLPLFPTTTIGSFPQTTGVRNWRAKWKKGELTGTQYDALIKAETAEAIRWQENAGLDVLVHGEFERNDMVEYFGEQLDGFFFTQNGWVQSYGSRCVKPPVIAGDVERTKPMTVYYTQFAQALTKKWVKGMLTGPVTILQWSFVRNDQPRAETCKQIALAIREEVAGLEAAGIRIIHIDEPAIREGLPLRRENWPEYLDWAVEAFKIASCGVADHIQIHTHMCYAEFNDIIESIAAMDADVITIETSRSQMELLDAFAAFKYPNDIGPGVYDIHSPRIPSATEMTSLMHKALDVIPAKQLWVNPDCGLKTRDWPETKAAMDAMVQTAKALRQLVPVG